MAGEHVLLLGPPGSAKSVLGSRLAELVGGAYFERLLTRFSVPEELFGPLSMRELENDRYVRQTRGYLPEADVAFIDEIFKANSSILNTLLTLINERLFDNGDVRPTVPLLTVVAASNELPESDELDALYDRFLLRCCVRQVSDEGVPAMLAYHTSDAAEPAAAPEAPPSASESAAAVAAAAAAAAAAPSASESAAAAAAVAAAEAAATGAANAAAAEASPSTSEPAAAVAAGAGAAAAGAAGAAAASSSASESAAAAAAAAGAPPSASESAAAVAAAAAAAATGAAGVAAASESDSAAAAAAPGAAAAAAAAATAAAAREAAAGSPAGTGVGGAWGRGTSAAAAAPAAAAAAAAPADALTRAEIVACQAAAARCVSVPRDVIDLVADLREHLQGAVEPPVYVSDRRLVKAVRLMKVAAYCDGRTSVQPFDCLLLCHMLWHTPDGARGVYDWVMARLGKGDGAAAAGSLLLALFTRACLAAVTPRWDSSGSGGTGAAAAAQVSREVAVLTDALAAQRAAAAASMSDAGLLEGQGQGQGQGLRSSLWLGADEAEAAACALAPRLARAVSSYDALLRDAVTLRAALSLSASGAVPGAADARALSLLLPRLWAGFVRTGDLDDVRSLGTTPLLPTPPPPAPSSLLPTPPPSRRSTRLSTRLP